MFKKRWTIITPRGNSPPEIKVIFDIKDPQRFASLTSTISGMVLAAQIYEPYLHASLEVLQVRMAINRCFLPYANACTIRKTCEASNFTNSCLITYFLCKCWSSASWTSFDHCLQDLFKDMTQRLERAASVAINVCKIVRVLIFFEFFRVDWGSNDCYDMTHTSIFDLKILSTSLDCLKLS